MLALGPLLVQPVHEALNTVGARHQAVFHRLSRDPDRAAASHQMGKTHSLEPVSHAHVGSAWQSACVVCAPQSGLQVVSFHVQARTEGASQSSWFCRS